MVEKNKNLEYGLLPYTEKGEKNLLADLHLRNISVQNKLALQEYADQKNLSISKAADVIFSKVFANIETIEREQLFINHLNRNPNAFNEMTSIYRNNTKQLEVLIKYLEFHLE